MKYFFLRHKKLHIWLLADLGFLAAYLLLRGNRGLINALTDHVTGPLRRAVGRVCYLVPFSVMEVIYVVAVLFAAGYLAWSIFDAAKAKGHRWDRTYRAVLGAACGLLSVWAAFCLLWGINFWADSFQDKSGIYARPVALKDLMDAAAYFSDQVRAAAE